MPRCTYWSLLPLLFILVVASPVTGQQAPESLSPTRLEPKNATSVSAHADRPKIGVALEGGGALGLAHIGVLQWFEDHHIPIDYIAGTSMGGLVGGLYASGKSPGQLRELVEQQNWDSIIGGRTQYQDLSFRRKEDLRAYPNSLIVGLKDGLHLPAGFNAG
jgi:NTE family protein